MTLITTLSAQNISIIEDAGVSQLMSRYVELNKSKTTVDGWRIQLLSTTDRRKVEEAKRSFQYRYPNIYVDWIHSKPYYQLRAGAFASNLDAIRMLYVIKEDYPNAYPTKDNTIHPSELVY